MSSTNTSRWAPKLAALDANMLVALDALLQESSVTAAARRIGITQSAMSQTLARLRNQFDDPILVKVGRGMELSPFGRRIRSRLQHAIAELEAVLGDRPVFDTTTASNRFVLAMVDYLSLVLLPEIFKVVTTEAPRVGLAVHALDAETVSPGLQQGIIDLYIGVSGDTERALETQRLFEDPLIVVVRRGHPLARKRTKKLEAYAEASHILVSPRRESGSTVSRALAALGRDRHLALEVPYFGLVPELLVESDLVATVPRRVAEIYERDHPVELLEPPLKLPTIEICMAWHSTFASDPAQIWLRELVARVCRKL